MAKYKVFIDTELNHMFEVEAENKLLAEEKAEKKAINFWGMYAYKHNAVRDDFIQFKNCSVVKQVTKKISPKTRRSQK